MTTSLGPISAVVIALISTTLVGGKSALSVDPVKTWSVHSVADLLRQRADTGRSYLPFLDHDALSMGIYVLDRGAADLQQPHNLDETYYVLDGSAILEVEGDTTTVQEGDVVYVGAHAKHRFRDIDDDLQLLVFFSKKPVTTD